MCFIFLRCAIIPCMHFQAVFTRAAATSSCVERGWNPSHTFLLRLSSVPCTNKPSSPPDVRKALFSFRQKALSPRIPFPMYEEGHNSFYPFDLAFAGFGQINVSDFTAHFLPSNKIMRYIQPNFYYSDGRLSYHHFYANHNAGLIGKHYAITYYSYSFYPAPYGQ